MLKVLAAVLAVLSAAISITIYTATLPAIQNQAADNAAAIEQNAEAIETLEDKKYLNIIKYDNTNFEDITDFPLYNPDDEEFAYFDYFIKVTPVDYRKIQKIEHFSTYETPIAYVATNQDEYLIISTTFKSNITILSIFEGQLRCQTFAFYDTYESYYTDTDEIITHPDLYLFTADTDGTVFIYYYD